MPIVLGTEGRVRSPRFAGHKVALFAGVSFIALVLAPLAHNVSIEAGRASLAGRFQSDENNLTTLPSATPADWVAIDAPHGMAGAHWFGLRDFQCSFRVGNLCWAVVWAEPIGILKYPSH